MTEENMASSLPGKGRALALGVGGAGADIIRRLKNLSAASFLETAVIDTDSSALENHPADHVLAASSDWNVRTGAGCGGDVIRGERALARERGAVKELIRGYDLIVVTAGLGGGTATGGLRTVASVIRGFGIPAVFLLTTPFSFESFSRRKNTEDCIAELLPVTDILLTLPNDLLFSRLPPDAPASEAFETASVEMAKTIAGIASVIHCRDLIGSDYPVFMAALRGHRCACGIGTGAADSSDCLDRASLALDRMVQSPFLGGMDYLKKADAAIVILSGGRELSLSEMKRNMEHASALLSPDTEALLGVAVSPDEAEPLRMTAIAIHYEDPDYHSRKRNSADRSHHRRSGQQTVSGGELFQDELALTSFSRGIFDELPVTKYQNIDLDVPTFQREDLPVDKGS